MTVALASEASADVDGSSTLTITKPSGLAEDDLMIVFIGQVETTSVASKTGWTEIDSVSDLNFLGSNDGVHTCLAKIADASDAAASNFVFTLGANSEAQGTLYRITSSEDGFDVGNLIASDTGSSSANPNPHIYTGGLTPVSADSLMIMGLYGEGAGSGSSYAIATDDPTWTEQEDRQYTSVQSTTQMIASASRPEISATGDFQSDFSVGQTVLGILVAINESISITVSGTTGTITMVGKDGTVTGDANITGSTGTITLTGNDGTVTTPDSLWKNDDKTGTASFTNESKS